jgi:hypothetical protein
MGLSSGFESNAIGGMGGYGIGGGFGGGGIIEGLLLGTLLNRGGRGGLFGGNDGNGDSALEADGIAAKTALLVNQSQDQNALLLALAAGKDATIGEGRALQAAICATDAAVKDGNYAAAIQAERNTNEILRQQTAFAVAASRENDVNTAAILARINQSQVDELRDRIERERDERRSKETELIINNTNTNTNSNFQVQAQAQLQAQLDELRRSRDSREIEINNINTNTQVQSQLQAQAQLQAFRDADHNRKFDALLNQTAKVGQDIVNIGGVVAANQTSNPTNVNSKQ